LVVSILPAYPRVIDDVTARLVAGEVLVVVLVAVVTRAPWVFAVLAVDFILRTALGPRWSPLALLAARALRPRLAAAPRPTPGPPKRFAAAMGMVFTLAIPAIAYGGVSWAAWSLAGLMVVFAALESFFGICAGCIVFGLLIRAGVVPEKVCVECADISLRTRIRPAAR
jgi:Domain of unknown function (DUF4395)